MKPHLRILVAIAPVSPDMPVEEFTAFRRLSDREIKTLREKKSPEHGLRALT